MTNGEKKVLEVCTICGKSHLGTTCELCNSKVKVDSQKASIGNTGKTSTGKR